jgi:hypothetical protein
MVTCEGEEAQRRGNKWVPRQQYHLKWISLPVSETFRGSPGIPKNLVGIGCRYIGGHESLKSPGSSKETIIPPVFWLKAWRIGKILLMRVV